MDRFTALHVTHRVVQVLARVSPVGGGGRGAEFWLGRGGQVRVAVAQLVKLVLREPGHR